MYAAAGKWTAAHKVAMGFLPEDEVHVSHCFPICIERKRKVYAMRRLNHAVRHD